MALAKVTIRLEVPSDEVEQAVAGFDDYDVVIISDILRRMGLPTRVNQALVASKHHIDSVDDLCRCTEDELLSVTGFGYGGLLIITRQLMLLKRHLRGRRMPARDRIENLGFTGHWFSRITAYEMLKKAGLHRISDITSLDFVALEQIMGEEIHIVSVMLREMGLSAAPLSSDRTLGELRGYPGHDPLEILARVGFGPEILVTDLTRDSVRHGLITRELNDDEVGYWGDDDVDYWLRRVTIYLRLLGYILP